MKINTLLVVIIGIIATSCIEDRNLPVQPMLKGINLTFKEVGDSSDPDSLILQLQFQDGDGNLGIGKNETSFPFNEVSYFSYNPETKAVTEFSLDTIRPNRESDLALLQNAITFSNRSTPELDTLPSFDFPDKCNFWRVTSLNVDGLTSQEDTFYVHRNPRYYNIYVDFFIENSSGEFDEFLWENIGKPQCNTPLHGRFPYLDIEDETVAEGNLKYRMVNTGWKRVIGNKRFKVRAQILDRDGQYSNEVTTDPVTLDDIKVN